MSVTVAVSDRGQITLPAAIRKRLGIQGGDVMTLEECADAIVLRTGIVLEYERYSDEQIAAWDAADTVDDRERVRLLRALGPPK